MRFWNKCLFIYKYIIIYVMKNSDKRLTTVRIDDNLFQEFKFQCIKNKFSFQKLASRCIFLYLTNKKFRAEIHNLTNINLEEINED